MPILFLSELVGLALGIEPGRLGLGRHFVSTAPLGHYAQRASRERGGALMARIGVFVCHCGENIARTVDCARVAEALRELPGVAHAVDYKYMCSDPGQALIKQAIAEKELTASSSPPARRTCTRRRSAAPAPPSGLNPFLAEMANIREHCSWIHEDRRSRDRQGHRPRPLHRREGQEQRPARDDPHPGGTGGRS